MNFKSLLLSTFAFSVALSFSTKNNMVVSEPSNNLKTNYQKFLTNERSFTYKKAISHKINKGKITSKFSPQDQKGYKIDLDTFASALGYDHFNWVSYVEADPYGIEDVNGNMMSVPYNDPPVGGYEYDLADRLPFYWDVENCTDCKKRHHIKHRKNLHQFELTFKDAPTDSRLQPGESIEFMTSLVGVKSIDQEHHKAEWDVLHTFRWKTTKTATNDFQISLIDSDVDAAELSPFIMAKMILDGAKLSSNSVMVSNFK